MKDITITMPIHRYNELLSKEKMYDDKSDVIYIENHWHDEAKIVYYKDQKALKKIQERVKDVLDDYIQHHNIIHTASEKKGSDSIFDDAMNWGRNMFKMT